MPAKKKPNEKKHENKVLPILKGVIEGADYSDLEYGQCFLHAESLWMKEADGNGSTLEQVALNLITGKYYDDFCGKYVIPVEITINWRKK